jgi:dCMP deaminase
MSEEKYIKPSWDDYFMAIAKIIGTRSSCDRLRSGAILVKDNRIISTGYNGAPPKLEDCDEVGHLMEEGHCVRTIHGEHNTILQAAIIPGATTTGTTMYTKYAPCIHCCKYVVAAGIKKIVYSKIYRNSKAIEYLTKANIEMELYKENEDWNQTLRELFSKDVEVMKPKEGDVTMKVEK